MGSDLHGGSRPVLALAALLLAGCGETLIDHAAAPQLLALVCAPDRLVCDGQCLACSPPPNAHATCAAGGACGFACEAGFNQCAPGACQAESPTSCGPTCADCSASVPANAVPVCNDQHACDFECQPGFLRSGSQCQRATALSVGFEHTCAITADARMKCWGSNEFGQLGIGAVSDYQAIPVDVPLPGPVRAISAGYYQTCAIAGDALYCWGDNTFGEVGDGTTVSRPSPTLVALPRVEKVFAGGVGDGTPSTLFAHTCATVAGGELWCWGINSSGQLGDGTTTTRTSPVRVTILPPKVAVSAVAIGERHTCALADQGAVYCWGANDSGQLGTGGWSPQVTTAVPAISGGASMVVAGEAHTCALVGRSVRCWGLNASAQVDPANGPAAFPWVLTPSLDGVRPTLIAAGRAHTCGLDDDHGGPASICCFGENDAGQLGGEGDEADVELLPPGTAVSIGAGNEHTCILTGEGGIQCWGSNEYGQLGNGALGSDTARPVYVSGR